jgi:large subunit ribosomal protein L23
MRADSIIVKPLLTEKTNRLTKDNVYTFQVHLRANKHQITEVVKKMYNVEIGNVRTIVRKGKVKNVGRRQVAKKQADEKIAYITVTKGTINVFPKA